ncbi:hypothetical protein [Saccharothrix sp. HUAS TT1]|uniref:hypothetical protein n=1 Tax=unclassified Saccharothrix TaxID=2593673 RepID=UPI00345BCE65
MDAWLVWLLLALLLGAVEVFTLTTALGVSHAFTEALPEVPAAERPATAGADTGGLVEDRRAAHV